MDALIIQGQEIRRDNAIAQNANIGHALQESGRPERVNALDMTIQQERQDPNNSVPQMSVGTLVTTTPGRDGNRPTPAPRASRRKAA